MSMLFDIIFIVQHYCLYGPVENDDVVVKNSSTDAPHNAQGERQPLISASTRA
jgi:cystinosin